MWPKGGQRWPRCEEGIDEIVERRSLVQIESNLTRPFTRADHRKESDAHLHC
jgi:hypothetical protein